MNVNMNSFNPSVLPEWGVAAGAPKFADAVGGVSSDVRAGEFLLSVEDGGAARSVSFQMPELDPPQIADGNDIAILCDKLGSGDVLNLSSDDVEAVCSKLTEELKAFTDALAAGEAAGVDTSGKTTTVMFDLYALMALLVECGQKMRDAARDVRQAENEQVQTSIQNQADQQRSAALTGLVASVAVCVIQVGMQSANLARLGKGVTQQGAARNEAGIESARADLKAAELQAKPQDAQAHFEKISASTDPAVKAKVEGTFNDSKTTKAGLDDASLDNRIQSNTAKLHELKYGPGREVPADGRELPMTKSQQVQAEKLQAQINSDAQLKAMPMAERQTLYRTQVKSELADIRNNPNSTKAEIEYAEAYAANELAQNSSPQQLSADLAAAQANYPQASTMVQHSATYLKGVQLESSSRMYGDMIMAIGNVAQGCVSSITEMMKAQATEMGAEQQASQEMLDQAKDLFSQCQSLIDSVIQLMQGVLQAEVQSMRDAIQA